MLRTFDEILAIVTEDATYEAEDLDYVQNTRDGISRGRKGLEFRQLDTTIGKDRYTTRDLLSKFEAVQEKLTHLQQAVSPEGSGSSKLGEFVRQVKRFFAEEEFAIWDGSKTSRTAYNDKVGWEEDKVTAAVAVMRGQITARECEVRDHHLRFAVKVCSQVSVYKAPDAADSIGITDSNALIAIESSYYQRTNGNPEGVEPICRNIRPQVKQTKKVTK